jgi:hypothetical protein
MGLTVVSEVGWAVVSELGWTVVSELGWAVVSEMGWAVACSATCAARCDARARRAGGTATRRWARSHRSRACSVCLCTRASWLGLAEMGLTIIVCPVTHALQAALFSALHAQGLAERSVVREYRLRACRSQQQRRELDRELAVTGGAL